uniref:Uncharacterized protein n=1 Tax=Chromera velia CCMP2878 TaxID=1169474 RepID=A0A0G4HBR2_9ALVE|eukprot:Cvel_25924.t1-p1 / transcript=Cvel_25924.t1 / gene=Cvel_25924 / organism=Chromera_velia_CCMP2878 / gene_product=hypothetical protein / transcript_product=hypothetical protein / location=Cvel_scaffold2999:1265-1597(+) / protein_length=111 / sequence_SO=supercontig / SO=protein_coding / is_pseudo=false
MTPRRVEQPGNVLWGLGFEPPGRGSSDRISFGNLLKEAPVFRDGEMQAVVESSKLIKIGIEGVEESVARRDLVQLWTVGWATFQMMRTSRPSCLGWRWPYGKERAARAVLD